MGTSDYAARHRKLGLCRNCPQPLVAGSAIYCEKHRVKDRERGRLKDRVASARLKEECFRQYGNKCACCGESTIEFLTIEHELGNGNNHRRELFKHNVGGSHMYRWLKKNGYPAGFSILCMNCNWAKRYGGICPHKNGEVA